MGGLTQSGVVAGRRREGGDGIAKTFGATSPATVSTSTEASQQIVARILWAANFHVTCCYPALPVMLEMQRRGHEVVVQSVPSAEPIFRHVGFDFRPNNRFPAYDFGDPAAAPFSPDEELVSDRFWKWWRRSVRDQFADTLERIDSDDFDLVFSKSCVLMCGAGLAAQKRGTPWVSYIHFCFDETEPSPPGVRDAWNRLRGSLDVAPEIRPDTELYWAPYSPTLTLLIGIPELQHRSSTLPSYARSVGPLAWDPPASAATPAWLDSLGTARPAVLVSTSNLWQEDADLVAAAAAGLVHDDVDIIANVPASHELPPLARDVIVTGFFPHGRLITRIQAVVCAAGFGTTQRAILAGVPPVVVPRGGDGSQVARAVERAGAGIVITPDDATPETIRSAVLRTMSDGSMRSRVAALRASTDGRHGASDAADLIEDVLHARP